MAPRRPLRRSREKRHAVPYLARPRTAAVVSLDARAAALDELREGLARSPREIACKYLYDDRGSQLFEDTTRLEEYFPTRPQPALLEQRRVESVSAPRVAQVP